MALTKINKNNLFWLMHLIFMSQGFHQQEIPQNVFKYESDKHKKLNLCLLRFWVKICLITIQNYVTSVLFKCRRKMISEIHDIALLLHSLHHRKRFKEYNQTHCREILYDVLTFPLASKCVFSRLSKNLASFYQNNKNV